MTPSSKYIENKSSWKIVVWMTGVGKWGYFASMGIHLRYGTVEANNRIQAVNAVHSEVS